MGVGGRPEQGCILDTYQNTQNLPEVSLVSIQATREYLAFLWIQYQEASRRIRSHLLDEIVKNTRLHRCSAKRLMTRPSAPTFGRGKGKSVNAYSDKSMQLLKVLWKDMGYMGAVRLKTAIQQWIGSWQHPEMDDYTFHQLKSMSASTIERVLKVEKANLRRRTNTGTKQGNSKIKTIIPIRELGFMPKEPGHCEIDCVAHCGGSLTGNHIWTLTVTDILTGHTENEALEFKNGFEVMLALHRIEDRMPFKFIALYMDNGSEFLNEIVYKSFSQRKNKLSREQVIKLFRSRPYKKNDQCYVEQKNYTHVRELFGYDRFSGKLMVRLMNSIYRNEWRLLSNLFHPQIRLKAKVRIGAKVKRTFHKPVTPFENLKAHLTTEKSASIQLQIDGLNPFNLVKKLKRKLRDLQLYNSRSPNSLGKHAM